MSDEPRAFLIEECHIPSLAEAGMSPGMTITGDYYIVRRATEPLKGYPLLITGHAALALFFASMLSKVGEEEIERRWAKGEFREFEPR